MRNALTLVLIIMSACLLAGCSSVINHPAVNAAIPARANSATMPTGKGDTQVIARLRSHRKYAKEPVSPNSERNWFVTVFDVLKVERGKWDEPTVSYIRSYDWPTPESGIILDMPPDFSTPPMFQGTVWSLRLDTTTKPAKLVGYEERSLVPPHDKPPVELAYEPADPKDPRQMRLVGGDALAAKIHKPIQEYMASIGKKLKTDYHFQGLEQTDAAYVTQTVGREAGGHSPVWTFAVDKKTGQCKLLWSVP